MTDDQRRQLAGLLSDRAETKNELGHLTAQLQTIEYDISVLIAAEDGPVKMPGFGSVVLSKPSTSTTFDPAALRELVQSLKETGQAELAAEIEACTKTTERAGSLRITPERVK